MKVADVNRRTDTLLPKWGLVGRFRTQHFAVLDGRSDSFKPYQYIRESNCLTNFFDSVCSATQNIVGEKDQFATKIS